MKFLQKDKMKLIYIAVLIFVFYLSGCINPPLNQFETRKILTCSTVDMDLDYPYLYVAAWTDGLWRIDISNDDFDSTYIQVMDPSEPFDEVYDVTAEGDDIIVSTMTRVWRSVDGGSTWAIIADSTYLYGIDRFTNQAEKIIYDRKYGYYICYTEDYGDTWDTTHITDLTTNSSIRIHPYKEGEAWIFGVTAGVGFGNPYLFCVDSCGKHIKLEVDMYNTFHCEDGLNHVKSIAFDPDNPENIFISASAPEETVFKSVDGGFSWQEVLLDTMEIHILCNDAAQSDKFYAINYNDKLYCITENFQSFQFLGKLSFSYREGPLDIIHEPVRNLLLINESSGIQVVKLND